MQWYERIWNEAKRVEMKRCEMIWHDMKWSEMNRHETIRHDMKRYEMIWHDMKRSEINRYETMWYDMKRYDTQLNFTWTDMKRYERIWNVWNDMNLNYLKKELMSSFELWKDLNKSPVGCRTCWFVIFWSFKARAIPDHGSIPGGDMNVFRNSLLEDVCFFLILEIYRTTF